MRQISFGSRAARAVWTLYAKRLAILPAGVDATITGGLVTFGTKEVQTKISSHRASCDNTNDEYI